MKPVLRFAPSPTGHLHVGNARMALINFLYAKAKGGEMILRLDDTDEERSKTEYEDGIRADLTWLGVSWDREERQSLRLARYEEVFEKLKADGWVYACYETPEELEYMRRRLRSRGKPPIYDRSGLKLTDEDRKKFEDEGRQPHWRFKIPDGEISWTDLVRGPSSFKSEHLADPVIRRADGTFLYMLPSAIDDIDMGVTHVTRGEDHVNNTAVQITMFQVLGDFIPEFAHFPLLSGTDGGKLSKREGSLSLADLRDDGLEAMAINSLLAYLGSSENIEAVSDMSSLIEGFDMERFGRATPKFDDKELERLNAKLLHDYALGDVCDALSEMGVGDVTEEFWAAARPNLSRLKDIKDWYSVCFGAVTPVIEEADYIAEAKGLLPEGDWDETTWKTWTSAAKDATGRKGKGLFMPLRQALTGMNHGPELAVLLPLIGREKAVARLNGETA